MLKFINGDLLSADVDALVNAVNTVGVMGKGLALQFKQRFPQCFAAYAAACRRGEVEVGKMFVFDAGEATRPRYIVHFPTKQHWRGASKLEYIERGLDDLVRVIEARAIRSIAVPALGAGLGGVAWGEVRPLIERRLGDLNGVDVRVYQPRDGVVAPARRRRG